MKVLVIDIGIGNLLSVVRALEKCGVQVVCSSDPRSLELADKIVLPGVGAFSKAMQELSQRGFVEPLRRAANQGTPLLGICLGMQLLFEESEEFGFGIS